MKKLSVLLLIVTTTNHGLAQNSEMIPEKWDFEVGKIEFLTYKGQKAARFNENSGSMFLKNFDFTDGTLEVDFEVDQASPFATIYFRQKNNDAEHVYVRTGAATRKNAFDALQYASIIDGVNLWDLQHEFQTSGDIKIGEWNHLKLVVSGKQLRVWLNNSKAPNLEIPSMEGNTLEGRIGLGSGFPGQTIFANLVIQPNVTEGLSPQAGPDVTRHDTRYLRNWQISKPDTLNYGLELNTNNIPRDKATWEPIRAERRGLINVSRKYGPHQGRQYVWLKTTITAEAAQSQQLKMGFSDEIWVFLNDRPIYVDKDNYVQGMRKSPNGRISLDNCSFPLHLQKGENELLIGLANDFYGWALMARLEHLEGVELE